MPTIDLYARVSRVGDRDNLVSDDLQIAAGHAEAAKRKLTVGREFRDLDQSGGSDVRPGLIEAIERIESGESNGIVCTRLDRFSRDTFQALGLAKRIEDAGGSLYIIEEPADFKSADGSLMVTIRLALATHQRKLANEYFEKSKKHAIERGIPITPRLAPGIRRVEEDGQVVGIELDPDVAPLIAQVFDKRVNGAGPAELADFLQEHGVKTSMGATAWSRQAIYGILKNRIYLGELRNGEYVNTEAVLPIVDVATFEAAQPSKSGPKVNRDGVYPLAGILRCAACRYTMQGTKTTRGKRIYRCTVRHASGRCEAPARVDADAAEQAVRKAFLAEAGSKAASESNNTDAYDAAVKAATKAGSALKRWATMDDETVADMGDDVWREGLRSRRQTKTDADALVGVEKAKLTKPSFDISVLDVIDELPQAKLREAYLSLFDCVAVRKGTNKLYYFRAGTAPEVPRRGFKSGPILKGFDLPEASS